MEIKIRYKRKHQIKSLISGFIWAVFGLLFLLTDEGMRWTGYAHFVLSGLYVGLYFIQDRLNYITIKDGYLSFNSPFKKKIRLSDVVWIKKFSPDYILITKKREEIINTQVIQEDSLVALNQVLSQLDLPPEKTPFYVKNKFDR